MIINCSFIDIHSHHASDADALTLLSVDIAEYPNQQAIRQHRYFSVGLHPWFINNQDWPFALERIDAAATSSRVLAIGECGLDKTKIIDTPLDVQEVILCRQIDISERHGKPLIIHCVRAFNELLQIKRQTKPRQPWIIHGFSGKPPLAKSLVKRGCWLSFGPALMRESSGVRSTLAEMPIDKIFLETDAADLPISCVYQAAAAILGHSVSSLCGQINANFRQVFGAYSTSRCKSTEPRLGNMPAS